MYSNIRFTAKLMCTFYGLHSEGEGMAAENDPRSKGNTALNVHKSRLKKLKLNQKKSILNQGKGVDRQIRTLTKKYSEVS